MFSLIGKAMLRRLNAIVTGVGLAVLHDVIADNEDFINDLQRQQFERGETSLGTPIEPEYSESTVRQKQAKGQVYDHVTLKDKENFYNAVYTQVFNNAFVTGSRDHKTKLLTKKYANIFGLTAESKQKLLVHIKNQYIQDLTRRIKL